jgi:DNA-binding transcriptional regulator YdaS (Cro superfamily)
MPMDLLSFIADPERKRLLAEKTGKSEGYLWQVASGWRGKRASPELAISIEAATASIGPEEVPRSSLRPDLWPGSFMSSEVA